jgi:hypothetical protein
MAGALGRMGPPRAPASGQQAHPKQQLSQPKVPFGQPEQAGAQWLSPVKVKRERSEGVKKRHTQPALQPDVPNVPPREAVQVQPLQVPSRLQVQPKQQLSQPEQQPGQAREKGLRPVKQERDEQAPNRWQSLRRREEGRARNEEHEEEEAAEMELDEEEMEQEVKQEVKEEHIEVKRRIRTNRPTGSRVGQSAQMRETRAMLLEDYRSAAAMSYLKARASRSVSVAQHQRAKRYKRKYQHYRFNYGELQKYAQHQYDDEQRQVELQDMKHEDERSRMVQCHENLHACLIQSQEHVLSLQKELLTLKSFAPN